MLFSGNKAFVIDFLETGVTLLCVFAANLERFVWGKYISPTSVPTGLLFNFIWCVCCYPLTTRRATRGGHVPPLRSPPCFAI